MLGQDAHSHVIRDCFLSAMDDVVDLTLARDTASVGNLLQGHGLVKLGE
jgi:hypothetical protein